jgi:hypothetical protein
MRAHGPLNPRQDRQAHLVGYGSTLAWPIQRSARREPPTGLRAVIERAAWRANGSSRRIATKPRSAATLRHPPKLCSKRWVQRTSVGFRNWPLNTISQAEPRFGHRAHRSPPRGAPPRQVPASRPLAIPNRGPGALAGGPEGAHKRDARTASVVPPSMPQVAQRNPVCPRRHTCVRSPT